MAGQPQTWLTDSVKVFVDLAEIQDRNRIQIQKRGRECVEWLVSGAPKTAIVELAQKGRILIRSMEEFGNALIAHVEALDQKEVSEVQKLVAIEDRFMKISMEERGRFQLYSKMLTHLGVTDSLDVELQLYIVCYPNVVEVWSQAYRDVVRQDWFAKLEGITSDT